MKRGDIFYVNFGDTVGSEITGVRPALVVQNNKGNRYSPTIIVVPITSSSAKTPVPTHCEIDGCGLPQKSVMLFEHIRTVSRERIFDMIGHVSDDYWEKYLKISLGLKWGE